MDVGSQSSVESRLGFVARLLRPALLLVLEDTNLGMPCSSNVVIGHGLLLDCPWSMWPLTLPCRDGLVGQDVRWYHAHICVTDRKAPIMFGQYTCHKEIP